MCALRLIAWLRDSRISVAAPSPITKPSRARSKGREARPGASLNAVERARSEQKPAKVRGVRLASAPPVITTSAWPDRIHVSAWPMAWALDEQAVEMVWFTPLAPKVIAMIPDAQFSVIIGMKFG